MKFMKKVLHLKEIRNKTNDSEEEQQVFLDNRKVGEESLIPMILIMEESVRSLTPDKRYPLLARQRKIEGSLKIAIYNIKKWYS